MADSTAKALRDALISPNEADRNGEAANVVDGLFAVARAIAAVARALRDLGNADAPTPMGGMEALGAVLPDEWHGGSRRRVEGRHVGDRGLAPKDTRVMAEPEMVERVARAIRAIDSEFAWVDYDPELQDQACRQARAAIAALREPSEEMLAAAAPAFAQINSILAEMQVVRGRGPIEWPDGEPPMKHAWRAMIAAALGESA